jgi:hypothetical protein
MLGRRRECEARRAPVNRIRYLGNSVNRRRRRRLSFQAVEQEAC